MFPGQNNAFSMRVQTAKVPSNQIMTGADGSNQKQSNPMEELIMDDFTVDQVVETKKKPPILTKKGQIIAAILLVGGALFYIYTRYKSSKDALVPTPEAPKQEVPTQAQASAEAVSTTSDNSTEV